MIRAREWRNDDFRGCHFFFYRETICVLKWKETRLSIGFPGIIEREVRKVSMLEIRGHKPLLTEGTLRASPPEEKKMH